MTDPRRVDVLLPTYNAAATVATAIDSALAQRGVALRLVVVDDGSTDETAAVARRALRDDRRAVLVSRPHRGLVAALHAGLEQCTAPWIARLDADDEMLPGRLRAQTEALAADVRLGAVDGVIELVGQPGEGMRRWARWLNSLVPRGAIDRELLVESPLAHPGTTLRREALDAVGGYRDGPFPEDYDLWLRMHAAGWRLAKLPQLVLRMTDHPARLTRTDPRYHQDGFRAVRQAWLATTLLASPRRVALWGAGREGRHWHRWLTARGCEVPALIDVSPRRLASGRRWDTPVLPPEEVGGVSHDLLLVAVGARGAREEIRADLARYAPSLREGVDWLAVR